MIHPYQQSPCLHKDRSISRTRERDTTHSYWYILSAPRENYSLLVMETSGMMKMASGDGFPLRQGARMGSRLIFMATETCGGGTPDLGLPPGVLEYLGIYRMKRRCGRSTSGPPPRGARQAPLACASGWWPPRAASPLVLRSFGGLLAHKKLSKSFAAFGEL